MMKKAMPSVSKFRPEPLTSEQLQQHILPAAKNTHCVTALYPERFLWGGLSEGPCKAFSGLQRKIYTVGLDFRF